MNTKSARETMAKAFKADPDYRRGYVDNIACWLMDRMPRLKHNKKLRDSYASDLVRLIFE